MSALRNVLIFHMGALGDFVLTWPLALALGRVHPQSRVYYVTAAQKGRLAERAIGVEWADVEAGWHQLYTPKLEPEALPEGCRKLLAAAHTVVTYVSDGADEWGRNVKRLAVRAELTALRGPREMNLRADEALAAGLAQRRALRAAAEQILRGISHRGVGLSRQPDGSVLIHPGAGSPAKRWPLAKFVELASRFAAQGKPVKWIVGEVEREQWGAAEMEMLRTSAALEQPRDAVELLELLARASMFIGNDSGPAQLAGLIGLPTFCLFGPTDPELWKPLGPAVRALRCQPLENLAAEQVWNWIKASSPPS